MKIWEIWCRPQSWLLCALWTCVLIWNAKNPIFDKLLMKHIKSPPNLKSALIPCSCWYHECMTLKQKKFGLIWTPELIVNKMFDDSGYTACIQYQHHQHACNGTIIWFRQVHYWKRWFPWLCNAHRSAEAWRLQTTVNDMVEKFHMRIWQHAFMWYNRIRVQQE